MKSSILLLFMLSASLHLGSAAAQCDSLGYQAEVYVSATGDSLPYRLLVPDSVVPGQRYPLVLFLHGAGERGHDNCEQLRHGAALFTDSEARQQHPAFVLFPQCPAGEFWPAITRQDHFGRVPNPFPGAGAAMSRPLRLASELLDKALVRLPIDSERVYSVGLSMGAWAYSILSVVGHRNSRLR